MFQRADRILYHQRGPPFPKHVLSYHWDDFVPHLITHDLVFGKVGEVPLDTLDITLSEEKRCVGCFDDDGGHHPCPHHRRVHAFAQCQECAAPWIPQQRCVFEPQCDGTQCDHPEFCGRLHVVYLAFYGSLVKVGMTSAQRLRRRGIEQGADAIAPVLECRGRLEARTLERELSKRFKVNQELRIKKIAQQWTVSPSYDEIEDRYSSLLRRIATWRPVLGCELEVLDGFPIRKMPEVPPVITPTVGHHEGEVLGLKGKFLIYREKDRGDPMLLDLNDTPGRFARSSAP